MLALPLFTQHSAAVTHLELAAADRKLIWNSLFVYAGDKNANPVQTFFHNSFTLLSRQVLYNKTVTVKK